MASPAHGGFGTPSSDDRRPWIWVAGIVSLAYSFLTLSARLLAKWELFGIEDGVICGAYLLGVVNWGLFDRATYEGLGASGSQTTSVGHESQLFYSSQVTLLCAIYVAKISVLLFGRRIFSGTKLQNARMFNISIGVTAIFGVASVALFSAGCNFRYALESPAKHCTHLQTRWTVIQVLDALTEAAIVALPTYYVSKNTVNLSSKITVISLFSLRLPNIAFMAVTATSYRSIDHGTTSHTGSVTTAAIWSQVLLGYALSSASFPCIRSFLTAFLADSKYRIHGTTMGSYNQGSYGNTGRQNNTQRSAKITSVHDPNLNQHLPDENGSVASDASQRMMIERSVEIQVAVESANSGDMSRRDTCPAFPYQGGQPSDLSRREPRQARTHQGGQ